MFKIYDGRQDFYQWDLDRKLIVSDPAINQVHFSDIVDGTALVCEVYELDGLRVANVPNILLQTEWKINAYAYLQDHTKVSATFKVIARPKPDSYVYTETETKNYNTLAERIEEVAAAGIPYAPTVNIWELDEGIYRIAGGFQWGQYEPPTNPRYMYITSGLLIVSVETRINDTRVYTVIADNKIYYGKSTPFEVINVDTGKKEVHVDGTIDYIEKVEKIDDMTTAKFGVPSSGAVKKYVDAAVAKSGISEVPSNYIWELESGVYHISQPIFYSQNLEGDQELIFCKDAYIVITVDDFKHRRSFRLFAEDGKVYYGYSEPHLVNTDNGTKTIVYSELEIADLSGGDSAITVIEGDADICNMTPGIYQVKGNFYYQSDTSAVGGEDPALWIETTNALITIEDVDYEEVVGRFFTVISGREIYKGYCTVVDLTADGLGIFATGGTITATLNVVESFNDVEEDAEYSTIPSVGSVKDYLNKEGYLKSSSSVLNQFTTEAEVIALINANMPASAEEVEY